MVLKSFRNASNSIVIKILFTAIILSFCLWGVGDIIRNYSASRAIAKVDKARITVEQFLREYSHEKQRIRNLGKKPLTDEELKALNIKDIVLDRLINTLIIEQSYDKFGIVVPKKSLVSLIHSMPEFQRNGGFSVRTYENALKNSGLTEQSFLQLIRKNLAQTQLLHPFVAGYKIPRIIKEKIIENFTAEHKIVVAKIDVADEDSKKELTEDYMKEYYEINKEKYRTKEKRNISILEIDFSKLAGGFDIPQEEIDKIYKETQYMYVQPEKRDFIRFEFNNKKSADNAWNLINKGETTANIKKKADAKVKIYEGMLRKDYPESVAKELFAIKEGKTSKVYTIGSNYYIYKLTKITKETKTEKEIKAEIREELINEKINSQEFNDMKKELTTKIDDGFGAGKAVSEIAKENGLKLNEIKDIMADNIEKINVYVSDNDTAEKLMQEAITLDEGQSSQIIESENDPMKSYVVTATKIIPSEVPSFETVKSDIRKDCIYETAKKELDCKLKDISDSGAEAVSKLKKAYKLKTYTIRKIDLSEKSKTADVAELSRMAGGLNVIIPMFMKLSRGEVVYHQVNKNTYLVMGLEKITVTNDTNKEGTRNSHKQLDAMAGKEFETIFLEAVKRTTNIKKYYQLLEKTVAEDEKRETESNS